MKWLKISFAPNDQKFFYSITGSNLGKRSVDSYLEGKDNQCSASLQSNQSKPSSSSHADKATSINMPWTNQSKDQFNCKTNNSESVDCTSTTNVEKSNQEVSRKGNVMGAIGWKAQSCMNGITFCFKVGGIFLKNPVSVCACQSLG